MRKGMLVALATAIAGTLLGLSLQQASAAFPGRNGLIVFDRFWVSGQEGRAAVFTMSANGSHLRQLTHGRFDSSPSFSPDHRRVVFVHHFLLGSRSHIRIFAVISVMNVDGSHVRQLTHPGVNVEDSSPAFSPDGRRIVFARDSGRGPGVFVMSADGSHVRSLHATTVHGRHNITEAAQELAFSPDGRTIAFAHRVSRNGKTEIFLMGADGSRVRRLTRTPGPGSSSEPDFSPDGSQIVFARDHYHSYPPICVRRGSLTRCNSAYTALVTDIFAMQADGSAVRQVTSPGEDYEPATNPAFSPDGRKIAFMHDLKTGSDPAQTEILTMNADGSNATRLTHSPRYSEHPSWQALH